MGCTGDVGTGFIPIRSLIWIMIFTCILVLYILRINMSLILLDMVEPVQDLDANNKSLSIPECRIIGGGNLSEFVEEDIVTAKRHVIEDDIDITRFQWDSKLQGLILGAYFYGFVISNIPAAAIAEKFGPRRSIAVSFAISSFLTLLSPFCASVHPYLLIGSRFFIGFFGGVVYPAVHCLISKWAPPAEKGKFISATLGGSLGTVLTWPFLGYIIEQINWNWAFYISGIVVLVWTIFWMIFVYDCPEDHPWIKEEERKFIVNSLAGMVSTEKRLPPYKSILVSIPAWSMNIAHFGNLWGLFFLMTAGPKFLSTVLGFNLGNTGFLAALPYLARMIAGFVFGIIGDCIVKRELMTKTAIRKSFIVFSHIIPGLLLILQTFVGCEVNWVIVLLTLSLATNGASTLTNLSNAQDLAPNFAGSVYGIANSFGSTTGFISPMVVGYLTAEKNGLHEWHTIFYIGAIVYIACGIFFVLFGSAEIQPWNYTDDDRTNLETNSKNHNKGITNAAYDEDKV